MSTTRPINSKFNAKQKTQADLPTYPTSLVTGSYGPVLSTAGQTVINLGFAVTIANAANFMLKLNGQMAAPGSAFDFTFTNIVNGTSSQVTMNSGLIAGITIQAIYIGVAQPTFSLGTLQAQMNALTFQQPSNALINGAFDLWQRGTSASAGNGTTVYQADRWYIKNTLGTSGVVTTSQTSGAVAGSKFGCQVQITTAPTAAQGNGTELYQVIENFNSLPFYNQTASFSAYIKALGNVNQIGIQFAYATTEVKPFLFVGTEQSVAVNTSGFTLGSLLNQAIGTAPTNAGVVGVRIRILGVSTGNTYDLNNGFVVEQAMMNVGATAGSFTRAGRNFQDELSMSQRYCVKFTNHFTTAGYYTTNLGSGFVELPTTMRAVPSLSGYSMVDNNNFSTASANAGQCVLGTTFFGPEVNVSGTAYTYGSFRFSALLDAEI